MSQPRWTGSLAIVHDYFTQLGGAERVVASWLERYPQATLSTILLDRDSTYPVAYDRVNATSALQRLPAFRNDPRRALVFMPAAVHRLRVPDAEVTLLSSSGWAHGVRVNGPSIVYCYSPARWLYERNDYLANENRGVKAALLLVQGRLRHWDQRAARQPDRYLAISEVVRKRIQRVYQFDSEVVHPPVDIQTEGTASPIAGLPQEFLLTIGRARGYKRTSNVVRAAQQLGIPVVAVGGERDFGMSMPGVIGLGNVHETELRWLYQACLGLVSASAEDFGLTPIEANAFGKPVAVLRAGGFLDTTDEGRSGVFFDDPSPAAIADSIKVMLDTPWDSLLLRANANRFSSENHFRRLERVMASVI